MQPTAEPEATRPPGWRLIRVTALFLAVLLPLHLVVVVVRGDIGRTTFATVSDRLTERWWPGLEWVTIVLALVHGFLVAQARLLTSWTPGPRRDAAVVAAGVGAALLGVGATWGMLVFS